MEQIALIFGSVFLYWSSIVVTLAAGAAICLYLSLMLSGRKSDAGTILSIPVALFLSLVFARLVHWYCRADQYESLTAALMNLRSGGYALVGVFAGCSLTAVLLRLVRLSDNLPRMLDCMAISGCAGIAIGRLACFFNGQDRGMIVTMLKSLPWAYPVVNPVSGQEELRLATFFLQALVAGALFAALLLLWAWGKKRRTLPDGDISVVFLLCYGASQVILDSTRYDSLYFRSNGFVSIVQVLSAVAIGGAAIFFSTRLVRRQGFRRWYLALWIALVGLIGLAGFMEYFVQRWSRKIVIGYSVMVAALVGVVAVTLVIRALSLRKKHRFLTH